MSTNTAAPTTAVGSHMANGHSHSDGAGHHDPGSGGHSHGVSADADRRALSGALLLILGFMVAEVVVGLIASSLALLADAAHMLTDAAALGLWLLALSLAARPAKGAATFGLKRAEILSAQFNGASLLVLAALIIFEALRRLIEPPHIQGGLMLAVALVGIVVNLAASWMLSKANRKSLNVEGSFQHILTDLYAFIGTAIAAAVILVSGFDRADPIASLLVAGLMVKASYGLLRDSGRIFLEMAPKDIDPEQVGRTIVQHQAVVSVHDLHVWQISSDMPSLSAYVLVRHDVDCHAVRRELERQLAEAFGIDHTTLQVDHSTEGMPIQIQTLSHRPD
jgi:cobalt-zinc-cadmium efflux system protein